MPEKDEFDSWEPQHMEEELQQPVAVEQELRQHMSETDPAKPAGRRRQMLLLVLLLVLGGAAAFMYLGDTPEPEAPQVVAPARKPIALPPPPPSDEALVKTETIPAAPTAVDAPSQPAAPGEVAERVEAAAGKAVAEKTEEKIAKVESTPQKASVAPVPAPATPSVAQAGPYALQAGAFLLKGNLRAAEATVRRLGYEPQVKSVRRTLPMTRLRVGGFFVKEGEAKLAAIKPIAPDAFLIRQGDFVLVYAGSYQDLDRARRVADQLYQQGVRVEEEPSTAEVTLSLLSFGSFANRDLAEQAAVKARSAGLEAVVRKTP